MRSLARRAAILAIILDTLGAVAVVTSREVQNTSLVLAAIIIALALIVRRSGASKLSMRVAVPLIFSILVAAVTLIMRYRYHPIDAAANVVLPIHAAILFNTPGHRDRMSRMGFGFLEIVLAAALNPEPITAVLIFLYFIVGAMALTLAFLERESPNIAPRLVKRMLHFNTAAAFVVFVGSLVFFPLLPRLKPQFEISTDLFPTIKAGYSEEIDMSSSGRWADSGDEPVMRVMAAEGQTDEVLGHVFSQHRYLRGRVLEKFDGVRWSPLTTGFGVVASVNGLVEPYAETASIEIIREAIGTHGALVPYGTTDLRLKDQSQSSLRFMRRASHDWLLMGSQHRRLRYIAQVSKDYDGSYYHDDLPVVSVHVALPAPWNTFSLKWKNLKSQAYANLSAHATTTAKALALESYFNTRGGYRGALAEIKNAGNTPSDVKKNLERFMFEEKTGHCGLFAAAVVILLRSDGIPARIVGGYALPRSEAGMITVRSRHAHAWVEAWDKGLNGWVVVDPTPAMPTPVLGLGTTIARWLEWASVRNFVVQDHLSRLWYGYILKTNTTADTEKQQQQPTGTTQKNPVTDKNYTNPAVAVTATILLSVVILTIYVVTLRAASPHVPRSLQRARKRLLRLEKRLTSKQYIQLLYYDERLRFSRLREDPEAWQQELQRFEKQLDHDEAA